MSEQPLTASPDDEPARCMGTPRDGRWPTFERRLILAHPFCAACGCAEVDALEGHHVVPFHEQPDRELDPENVRILCGHRANACHRLIGHGGNWRLINREVDAAIAFLAAMYARIRAGN